MSSQQNRSRWLAWLRLSVFKVDLALAILVTIAGVTFSTPLSARTRAPASPSSRTSKKVRWTCGSACAACARTTTALSSSAWTSEPCRKSAPIRSRAIATPCSSIASRPRALASSPSTSRFPPPRRTPRRRRWCLQKLRSQLGKSAPPSVTSKIKSSKNAAIRTRQFAAAMKELGTRHARPPLPRSRTRRGRRSET